MSIDLDQFKDIFYEESFENLELMESGLLELSEGGTDLEVVNTIFRSAHSIKGGSATFGFASVAAFTHVMEELLDEMREGKREAEEVIVNILLESVDVIRSMLSSHQAGEEPDDARANTLRGQLEVIRDGGKSSSATTDSAAESATESSGATGWVIVFAPHEDLLQTGNDPALMLRELAGLGDLSVDVDVEGLPALDVMDPELAYLKWNMTLRVADGGDPIEKDAIEEIFEWVEDECDLSVKAIEELRKKPDRRGPDRRDEERREGSRRGPASKKPSQAAASIRVGIDRLDDMMDLVGELVITQSMLSQLGEDFNMDLMERLRDGLTQLERNSRELQESMMRMRMQPVSFAFNRFPRMVHDMSQKLSKSIRLEMIGEDTEMDKMVMEKLNDPLVHLVRNSMDHGLEPPEERIAAGKNEEGYVRLEAFHQGGSIVVEISDDGRGLSREKILGKAIERGLVTEQESALWPDEQVFHMLFEAGFSTAEVVSDLSGRGVGLDVVRRNIESLGGRVDIRSTLGHGSTFSIRLPLTLAVLDGQLFRLGDQTYVLPLTSIIESLQIRKELIGGVGSDAEVYRLRDEYIPIIRPAGIFGCGDDRQKLDGGLLVIVEWDKRHVGLLVDELLSQQQVVIKSLEINYQKVAGISGATILGDGTVSLIVDIAGLYELSGLMNDRAFRAAA
ncbi:MAG: chemotaxis protein CheA [Mariprofundaceae bacterium]